MPGVSSRRARTAVAVAALLLLGGCAGAEAPASAPVNAPAPGPTASPAPSSPRVSAGTPSPEAPARNPLTGGRVSDHPVVAVKVENTGAARPQVGLSQADIVFVQEVEGAQTRLLAVYHSALPERLGPVRSARTTDAQLLPLFGRPGLVYSGANARVQRRLDAASLVPIYRETRDRRRRAPHNVFVDLAAVARTTGLGAAKPIGWTFAAEPPPRSDPATQVTARVGNDTFGFDLDDGRYTVTWRGERYTDGDTGAVTRADNVVVLRVRNVPDGNRDTRGSASVLSRTVGRGDVSVYRDGARTDGTWSRAKVSGPMRFTGAGGRDIALKPGRTWVLLVG